jgi:hypothetical protein
VFAVPAFGQVEGDVAPAVAGGAGSDRDQVAADRGSACFREGQAGQRAGRADQVCAIAAMDSQAAFAAKTPDVD